MIEVTGWQEMLDKPHGDTGIRRLAAPDRWRRVEPPTEEAMRSYAKARGYDPRGPICQPVYRHVWFL